MKSYAYRWLDTPVHHMHPLVMTTWAFSIMVLSFVIEDPVMLAALFAATLTLVYWAQIFDRWWGFFKLALFFSIFIVVLNVIFMHQGNTVIFKIPWEVPTMGHFDITLEAFFYSVGMAIRLITMITAFAILTYTVNPDDIFEMLMKVRPLQRTAFLISLAVSYVPALLRDMDNIRISLQTRGYELEDKKLVNRAKKSSAILLPLMMNSLDRSLQKAESMEARAYGTGKSRTCLFGRKLTGFDALLLAASLLPLAAMVLSLLIPVGKYQYYPELEPIRLTTGYAAAVLLLFLAGSAVGYLSLFKRRVDID
ncbi:MAG TPA: energy-coupling factor transporter transmembrane component T [Methanothrix sp.]|jgi:energy-coupling factor transport system permease protein|uniref:energy-coupling factor transporter transmembrane component T family protein n=1 Tax=Methanothrix sp. TaxID=90426 RepID=UPI001BD26035|nr:energy-coupling factor transporter transmembrane component T [Euryarchaeota archaeon]HON36210.1 energy-coupling factor transporter transmembrane component T [Methanothrix sp.]HRT16481.1 energy-coupling factor transporter transmembrane component T [Methanothrix sp.]